MKKSFLAIACALCAGQALVAQNMVQTTVVEDVVVVVEDPTQGILENRFRDNWFISLEGGVSAIYDHDANNGNLKDLISPEITLSAGKWFSPKAGFRANLDWFQSKTFNDTKLNYFGVSGDGLLNLTNWWCGYKPNRVYNCSFYAGAGFYVRYGKCPLDDKWKYTHAPVIEGRLGLLNTFRINNHWLFNIDLRVVGTDKSMRTVKSPDQSIGGQVLVGFTYNFNKTTWSAPVVPVCPEPENCDNFARRLSQADSRINDLEAQLKACLERPVQTVVEGPKAPLATIYFPINSYALNRSDRNVLGAIAAEMKANPNVKYNITGYADNYTGTSAYNERLRHNRANAVQKQLVRNGVSASQLNVGINNDNRNDKGVKFVALDRCVTIEAAE